MRRSLTYFWPMHLSVALSVAVTATVLTGALLIGDSMRGSLRDLTLERLGRIDHVLVAENFFREDLVDDLKQLTTFQNHFEEVVPAILLSGGAINLGTQARASQVNIQGIDDHFPKLFEVLPMGNRIEFDRKMTGTAFFPVVINNSLQKELGVEIGDSMLLTLRRPSDIHPEFTLGNRDPSDMALALRVSVIQIIPDRGLGRFGLRTQQSYSKNAFLPLATLQQALNRENRINSLLVVQDDEASWEAENEILQECLHEVLQLEDLNLELKPGLGHFALESRELIIAPMVEHAASAVSQKLQLSSQLILTYLANTIRSKDREIPYSTVTGIYPAETLSDVLQLTGSGSASLDENDILLNEWAALDLGAKIGDTVELSYYVVGPRDELVTESARFKLTGIVALKGLAVERELTPEIPGVHEADNISEWDSPVPIDFGRIRKRDEIYWDQYGTAPKAFVNFDRGQALWSSRFGRITSIRMSVAEGKDIEKVRASFEKTLLAVLKPSSLGLEFQPVKQQSLLASTGATNFGTLFLSFSSFLIVSAALLVGLLFRLGVEQRSSELGLLLSLGYRLRAVRGRFLVEGAVIAGVGSLLGLIGSVGYAWLLIVGLKTWWAKAVGSPFLSLHVQTSSLIWGFLVSWLVVLGAIWWGVRKLAAVPSPLLLQGIISESETAKPSRWVRNVGFVSLGIPIILIVIVSVTYSTSSTGLFFCIGTSLLVSGLAFFSFWVKTAQHAPFSVNFFFLPARIAVRNSSCNPGRSQLSVALVAVACFVIVTVAANRHEPGEELLHRDSGSGGFSWLARSDIPIHQDLTDPERRFDLGFSEKDSKKLKGVKIIPFRVLDGEDISCLNLYQPQKPRILGVTADQTERGGFSFQEVARILDKPWDLLQEDLGPGIIPAFGDANSVLWILHLGLGDHFELQNEKGETVKLRLVGLLESSIFQSELLISEANFLRHFPSQTGYRFFLIESPFGEGKEIAELLERNLDRHGLDVTSTSEVLADYLAVANTYLSTFQTLGALGLLLGTLGLGVVLVRNTLERKNELAILRTFGFKRSKLAWIVVIENGFLLTLGLMLGTVAALIAVAPHLASGSSYFPWSSLTLNLLVVFSVGLLAGSAAVWVVLRMPLLPALRTE